MSFTQAPGVQVDSDLQNFIESERQVTRFNLLVHALNDKCWDLCVNKVHARLEPKTEGCLVNCVERFLDTSNFLLNRLEKTQSLLSNIDSLNFD